MSRQRRGRERRSALPVLLRAVELVGEVAASRAASAAGRRSPTGRCRAQSTGRRAAASPVAAVDEVGERERPALGPQQPGERAARTGRARPGPAHLAVGGGDREREEREVDQRLRGLHDDQLAREERDGGEQADGPVEQRGPEAGELDARARRGSARRSRGAGSSPRRRERASPRRRPGSPAGAGSAPRSRRARARRRAARRPSAGSTRRHSRACPGRARAAPPRPPPRSAIPV